MSECKWTHNENDTYSTDCNHLINHPYTNYCPHCGRKVVIVLDERPDGCKWKKSDDKSFRYETECGILTKREFPRYCMHCGKRAVLMNRTQKSDTHRKNEEQDQEGANYEQ